MCRSLSLIFAFLFFSVALPCVCAGETVSLVMEGSCMTVSSSHAHDGESGTMTMNLLDHISSWRSFLSSALSVAFFYLVFLLVSVFGRKKRYARCAQIFHSYREIFHPPEYFDERVLLSCPILRAFYTGVLHAKVSH